MAELQVVWEYPTPREFPQALAPDALGRPFLHAAMKNGGLLILEVSNKQKAPREVARIGIERFQNLHVMHLAQSGEYLYLALGDFFAAAGSPAGLAVVHVKNPQQPEVRSVWKSQETLKGSAVVLVEGRHAYLGAMTAGIMIFDISRPSEIKRLSTIQPDIHFPRKNPAAAQHPNARGLALRGNHLYVAYDAGGLRIIDVGDKTRPREIGRYINAKLHQQQQAVTSLVKQQAFNDVVLDQQLAYVTVDYAGLEILDIRNPRDIRAVGWWNPWGAGTPQNIWFNSSGHTNQIGLDAKRKLAYLSAGDSELQVVDVADPAQPRLAAQYGKTRDRQGVWGLAITEDHVYLAYIQAVVPFQSSWAGIKAIRR